MTRFVSSFFSLKQLLVEKNSSSALRTRPLISGTHAFVSVGLKADIFSTSTDVVITSYSREISTPPTGVFTPLPRNLFDTPPTSTPLLWGVKCYYISVIHVILSYEATTLA